MRTALLLLHAAVARVGVGASTVQLHDAEAPFEHRDERDLWYEERELRRLSQVSVLPVQTVAQWISGNPTTRCIRNRSFAPPT